MLTDIDKSFSIVAERLGREDYKKIQYLPKGRARYFGHEFSLIRSFLLRDNVTIFRTSGLHKFYEQFMHIIHPKLYDLYKLFFQCAEFPLPVFLKFFSQHEFDNLIGNGIISRTDGRCVSNYRFVPIDDLLIVSSPDREYDTPKYVYVGGDSIKFWNFLKKTVKKPVNDALEIGCGTGFLSLWMSQIAQKVTATDISQRALESTRLNAKINGINNIVTKISDVYSDIRGKFDLLISNPPYEFLPEVCTGRTFAFGGNLGSGIVEKILLGLDDHLKDGGISFIMAVSYIKENGINPIYEMIKSMFHRKPYSITLRQLDYQPLTNYFSFYKEHMISYSIEYLIRIQKAASYQLTHVPIRGVSRVIENLEVKLRSRPKWNS